MIESLAYRAGGDNPTDSIDGDALGRNLRYSLDGGSVISRESYRPFDTLCSGRVDEDRQANEWLTISLPPDTIVHTRILMSTKVDRVNEVDNRCHNSASAILRTAI